MNPGVCFVVTPYEHLMVQMVQVFKLAAIEESSAYVLNLGFYLALRLRIVDPTSLGGKAGGKGICRRS